jgi:hypothetical protein
MPAAAPAVRSLWTVSGCTRCARTKFTAAPVTQDQPLALAAPALESDHSGASRWMPKDWLDRVGPAMRASPTLTTSPGADPMSKAARALCPAGASGRLLEDSNHVRTWHLVLADYQPSSPFRRGFRALCNHSRSCKQYWLVTMWERSAIGTDSVKEAGYRPAGTTRSRRTACRHARANPAPPHRTWRGGAVEQPSAAAPVPA